MATYYDIRIGEYGIYPVNIIDSGAKIDWTKGENGLIFEKKLDGKFILFRSTNEAVYDAIKGMTICEEANLRIVDTLATPFVINSVFGIRDIEYNDDKCQMVIKPRYLDEYGVDAVMDKDLNIINTRFPAQTITYNENYQFEFKIAYSYGVRLSQNLGLDCYEENWGTNIPYTNATFETYGEPWTFYLQTNTPLAELDICGFPLYDIMTTWFREVKYIPLAIDIDHDADIPIGTSTKPWFYIEAVELYNGIYYNKYAREVDNLVFERNTTSNPKIWMVTDYYGKNEIRTLTRARKLIDILDYFKTQFNCNTLHSEFFKNNVNPVSGKDLTNLMIEQKSDAIFEEGSESSDPARLGIITFRQLMEQLWAMFQVSWTIIDDVLYIEHISFFKWNFKYTQNTTIGLDLTSYYPLALVGSNAYTWQTRLPIREKFNFMEAWNIDFVGTDIEYTNCLTEGDTETYSADLITTDIDPTYLDNEASKDGFVIFHCNADNEVISEEGMISGISSPNAHLSWANLHHYYWKSYRPLPHGIMNGQNAVFNRPYQPLKKQVPLEFPFCSQNVDDLIYDLVKTTMGDGAIEHAEYSLKTGNLKIDLTYEST